MAVAREVYSLERYLIAGAVIHSSSRRRLSVNDADCYSNLGTSLQPEIEAMDEIGVLDSYFSPADREKKYMVSDEHAGDFSKVDGYFNTVYFPADYQKNWNIVIQEFDEVDKEKLSEEVEIVDLLT